MCAVRLAELERVTTFARTIVAPLAEVWSRRAGATVRIDTPQAAEVVAEELGEGLEGWFWVLPVEVTGVYSGAFSLLVEQSLLVARGAPAGVTDEKSAGRFAAIIDEFLAAAADRLTATAGSPITLDRLGLREVPGLQAAEILVEFMGRDELVAVHFNAEVGARQASDTTRSGGVAVVFGTGLAREIVGSSAPGADTVAPSGTLAASVVAKPAAAPAGAFFGTPATAPAVAPDETHAAAPSGDEIDALIERAGKLRLRLTTEVGRKTLTLGELLRVRRGSVIDLGRTVADPLEVRLGGRLVAYGDAVVLPSGYGVRIRA
jgi:flagellar motor switch/type III secretory pathway protein FliN